MSADGPSTGAAPVDRPTRWPVEHSEVVFTASRVISVRRDTVVAADGASSFARDVVEHPGSVGVLVLDDDERVLLIDQYRHPVGHRLLEAPAGLLDVPGEAYHLAAARELAEEGHVRATDWRVLVDFFSSPGMSTEAVRVYLARGISEIPDEQRHIGEEEEADMSVRWLPLAEVVEAVLAGRLHNPILALGSLAAWAARSGAGYDALRPVDASWPAREAIP
jgi:8-oxo-dGTP pyrophosphatase MutT (NUDIX family)